MNRGILHNGVIEKIEPPFVFVRIVQQSACSGCHAKSLCTVSESKVKTIEIEDHSGKFKVNEEVNICGSYIMGLQAVLLTFVVPLFLILFTLFVGSSITGNEILGGIISLSILLPYYSILYLVRNKLKKKFTFSLSKIN